MTTSFTNRKPVISMKSSAVNTPKHARIFEHLRQAIMQGQYRGGDRLPSEQQLVRTYATSRPTAARALKDLQACGLVERRVGSGTYVIDHGPHASSATAQMFGLLIPELGETEIFGPISNEIARSLQAGSHMLLRGEFAASDTDGRISHADNVLDQYIRSEVAGVFLAPVEITPKTQRVNRTMHDRLREARLPVVLLDRDLVDLPQRSGYDLVGVDNWLGGFRQAEHLIGQGARHLGYLARPRSASTVHRRISGFREAARQMDGDTIAVHFLEGEPDDHSFIRHAVESYQLDAIACANDLTAAHLMHTLFDLGFDVPQRIRIMGFDDVKYAQVMRVPLTTMHQPCKAIAQAAVDLMLQRLAEPEAPPRMVSLDPSLVVRQSCGGQSA